MLANAIIKQAVHDYVLEWWWLHRNPSWEKSKLNSKVKYYTRKAEAEETVRDVEDFFYSGWFGVLTLADGPEMFRRIQHETRNSCTFRGAWIYWKTT